MDTRIAERRAEVRRDRMLRRRRRTLWIVVLVTVGGLLAWLERSPLVALQRVEVVGASRIDPAAVRDAAALPLGRSTLRLRLSDVRSRVEALPLVHRATVRRVDPLTVRITVEERRPRLVVHTAGAAAVIDQDGVVLEHRPLPDGAAEASRADAPPVVVTTAAQPPPPGDTVDGVPGAASALRVHRQLPGPLRSQVERYDATQVDDLALILTNGVRVRFGRAERIDEKARVVGALLDEWSGTVIARIDVRAPSNPVVLEAGPPPPA
ncbi:MAG: FtsQ-type POTRA domain-containing protein [Actinomycetota bacterium]|nr:FtsQ-type POTRA domain-containing protein [Actinomycetota bacterium]